MITYILGDKMQTKILKIDVNNILENKIDEAKDVILSGGLVAFPTETVYGLGANANDKEAIKKIFIAKGRPSDNPLIVHIAYIEQALDYAKNISDEAQMLMKAFWGGPLTIILPKRESVPYEVTAGLETVAIRLPSHPVAHAIIKAAGVGIAAPSANTSGKPSPTIARHVIEDLDGKVDMIIDSGSAVFGVESTVIDMESLQILRPGAISLEDIKEYLPNASYGTGGDTAPKSPGMKYTHYSPKAKVILVTNRDNFSELANKKTAIIAPMAENLKINDAFVLSAGKNNQDYAARLFYLLRKADELGAEVIYAQMPSPEGIGQAVINRLLKASGGNVL